ncbi:MAG: glycosyltransferase family 2 protein [Ignavibacteria bacterium]|nr:glycosyltransferase family 2 protein [Ignavibacteria bacterium]
MPPVPLVSILLPTHDRRHLLGRAVASVQAQTETRWELIVVDDGSTDGTGDFLRECRRADARIRFARQPRGGPSSARNRAFALSRAPLIAYLDSDDEYLPTHLALRLDFMDEHPDVAFLHGGIHVIGTGEDWYVPDARDLSARIHLDDCVIGGTFFARREAIEASGGWTAGYAEDYRLHETMRHLVPTARVDFRTYVYHRDSGDSRCGHPRTQSN